ncbi:unnamed protein product [Brassicogethes aeneus]|uniref:Uncharacterized protein n=1 Tax=Brassicogethes aeneus TaxID=1431903 RepID=A0A9P0B0C1_BRAAE|nr:unnamed protein product [Brassicogethes aeneus]
MKRGMVIVVFCSFLLYFKASSAENNESNLKEIFKESHDYCVKESHVNEALVNQAKYGRNFVNNPELKCYLFCLFTHFQIIDKDTGKYTVSAYEKKNPKEIKEKFGPVLKNCKVKDFDSDNFCEEAWEYFTKCFVNQPTASSAENNESNLKEIFKESHDYCVKESHVKEALVNQAKYGRIFVNNPELKCYLFCLFTHFQIIDKDTGKFTVSAYEKKNPKEIKEKFGPVLKNCKVKDFDSDNFCEEAWEYFTKCFVNQPTASSAENNESNLKEIFKESHDYCVKESHVKEGLVNQAKYGRIFVNNPELKCYLFCLFTHFQIIDKDTGKYTVSAYEKKNPKEIKEKFGPVLKNCKVKDFDSDNFCEEAWEYFTKCFVNQPTFIMP